MNRIESAVTSVAGEMTALEVACGIVPVACTPATAVAAPAAAFACRRPPAGIAGAFAAGAAVACAQGCCTAAPHYLDFKGESRGMSVGDLLQARRGLAA